MKSVSITLKRKMLVPKKSLLALLLLICIFSSEIIAQQTNSNFAWPKGKQIAVSLSFDDGRLSQVDVGTPFLDQYGVKATFYVGPNAVKERLDGWKKAVTNGHEIGNHSLNHPCTGNFPWSRQKALEDYTIDEMREELISANKGIKELLGVEAKVFAYPCGQTFIGRAQSTKSYVPVVSELFLTGRGWLDEGPNDPTFCDFAQLTGMEMDGKDFNQILTLINNAKKNGSWLVLAGHEIGETGGQTTSITMLRKLIEYSKDPTNGIWIAPVGTIAKYIQEQKN
jgi:peptidoglycan/xylan/chitin deacetylase (PgdA/CDA1 family)